MKNFETVGIQTTQLPRLLGEKPCNRIYWNVIKYPIHGEGNSVNAKCLGCLGYRDSEGNEVMYRETERNFMLSKAALRNLIGAVVTDKRNTQKNQIIPVFDNQFIHDENA